MCCEKYWSVEQQMLEQATVTQTAEIRAGVSGDLILGVPNR